LSPQQTAQRQYRPGHDQRTARRRSQERAARTSAEREPRSPEESPKGTDQHASWDVEGVWRKQGLTLHLSLSNAYAPPLSCLNGLSSRLFALFYFVPSSVFGLFIFPLFILPLALTSCLSFNPPLLWLYDTTYPHPRISTTTLATDSVFFLFLVLLSLDLAPSV
ncbi:hypothetical protein RSAG8_07484, partial [Rhizoctonia solani AG-8 WAC10335]